MRVFQRLFTSGRRPAAMRRPEPVFVVPPRQHHDTADADPAGPTGVRPPRYVAPGEAFTPTQPKVGRRRLVGREAELRRILDALTQDRAHVVLYSERGRGKTSLANLVVESLRRTDTIVARHTCEAGTTFDSLMRELMHDLPPSMLAMRDGGMWEAGHNSDDNGCANALPSTALRPRDIVTLPQRLNCRELVCVVDEFDRVEDAGTRTRLADTIKQLSDEDVPLLFLIVGVSENLDQILGQHPSIQRAVLGIHLTLFSDRDVAQMILRGGQEIGLTFCPSVIAQVTVLARGMPYIAQLFGLRLAQAATLRGDETVRDEDLNAAVMRLLEDTNLRVLALYAALTDHGRDGEMTLALRHLATASQDSWGRLRVLPSAGGGVTVGSHVLSPSVWNRIEAAHVLQSVMPGSGLFVFGERALMHHALLLAALNATLPIIAAADGAEDHSGIPRAAGPNDFSDPAAARRRAAGGRSVHPAGQLVSAPRG